jgi:hypothetical protein
MALAERISVGVLERAERADPSVSERHRPGTRQSEQEDASGRKSYTYAIPIPGRTDRRNTSCSNHDIATPLRVVIAYGDVSAGRQAMSMLNRLVGKGPGVVRLFPAIWGFALLDDPELRDMAVTDVVDAHLLIVATSAPEAVPMVIKRWVRAALLRRDPASAALVTLLGCHGNWSILNPGTSKALAGFPSTHRPRRWRMPPQCAAKSQLNHD